MTVSVIKRGGVLERHKRYRSIFKQAEKVRERRVQQLAVRTVRSKGKFGNDKQLAEIATSLKGTV
jgi:hypothetical protein